MKNQSLSSNLHITDISKVLPGKKLKVLNIICDPMSMKASVQLDLVKMVTKSLSDFELINVISPFIPPSREVELRNLISGNVISLSKYRKPLSLIYAPFRKNEAVLWGLAWMVEALFRANSAIIMQEKLNTHEGRTINLSYTVPAECDLFWNQANPPLETLRSMGKSNPIAKILVLVAGRFIESVDKNVHRRLFSQAKRIANNSEYLRTLYQSKNEFSEIVIHSPKEFYPLDAKVSKPTRDYVLAYIGKETEIDTLIAVAKRGVRIVSFGSKIPFGTRLTELKKSIEFVGYVNNDVLSGLYYNALFTMFPFTEEPFGWIPLESMYYGTPVLTYNKQGPSETVIDGKTGWLVSSREDLIDKAIEIWNSKHTGIESEGCMNRARQFSLEQTQLKLNSVLLETQ